jgi:hypothetical protein
MGRSDRRSDRQRGSALRVGTAAGAAFAAALIGVAHAPAAGADPEADPFQLLFGDTGINSWTPGVDGYLDSNDPTLAADLDTSVDSFLASSADHPFTELTVLLDFVGLDAFGADGYPDTGLGDLAVGLDYSLFAGGLAPIVDPILDAIFNFTSDCIGSFCIY